MAKGRAGWERHPNYVLAGLWLAYSGQARGFAALDSGPEAPASGHLSAATISAATHGAPSVLPQQQSSRKDPDSEREVFRSAGSIVLSWAWLVVAVITLIDLAVQGRDHDAAITAALIVAISAVVYGCAWRPCIVADDAAVTVVNPLRDHRVPWAAVANVDVVHSVRVHCTPAPGSARLCRSASSAFASALAAIACRACWARSARRPAVNSAEVRSSASLAGSGNCPYPGVAPGGGPLRAERGGLVRRGRCPMSPARRAALLAELGEDCTAQL